MFRPLRNLLTVIVALATWVLPAWAGEGTGLYRKVGSWDVRVDSSIGYGCFIAAGYHDGSTLRLGIDNRGSTPFGYMLILNNAWVSIEPGRSYPVALSFDGGASANWSGSGIDFGGSKGLLFKFGNGKFFDAIAQRLTMRVQYAGRVITELPLPGTAAALAGMFECQKTFDAMHQATADPFSDPNPDPNSNPDPFSG